MVHHTMSVAPRFKSNNWFNFYKLNLALSISNDHLNKLHFYHQMIAEMPSMAFVTYPEKKEHSFLWHPQITKFSKCFTKPTW